MDITYMEHLALLNAYLTVGSELNDPPSFDPSGSILLDRHSNAPYRKLLTEMRAKEQ
ncbi:hypothetical protein [Stenotrophomonas phage BUCTxx99]|nr:hypothetical protein [Stenotrophomonas phage BUCTxx99]